MARGDDIECWYDVTLDEADGSRVDRWGDTRRTAKLYTRRRVRKKKRHGEAWVLTAYTKESQWPRNRP